jgi:hypothetical protein
VNIRPYREGEAPRVVELLQASFGAWPGPRVAAHDRPAEFFRWKHELNPTDRIGTASSPIPPASGPGR